MEADVAVIGGGPAGLQAAKEIGERGGRVVVLDENSVPGGKLLGQLHEEPSNRGWWNGMEIAARLVKEATAAGAEIINGVQVWGLEPGWNLHISSYHDDLYNDSPKPRSIRAKAVLLATGAVEKPLPVPGWTLPGVMTIGAAQVLTNYYKVKPGEKVIIAGLDVLSLSIARSLVLAGVHVAGVVLPAPGVLSGEHSDLSQVLARLFSLSRLAPNRILQWTGSLFKHPLLQSLAVRTFPAKGLTVWGIPLLLKKALVSIEGKDQVEGVVLADLDASGHLIQGSETNVSVDAVCLSGGLAPLAELAATAGCKFVRLDGLSGVVPLHNVLLETNSEGLFVAGNVTGIEGAKVAMAQGRLAGKSICSKLRIGQVGEQELNEAVEHVKQTRRRSEFQFHSNIENARSELQAFWLKEQL